MFGGERVILTELEHASKHSKAWLEEREREREREREERGKKERARERLERGRFAGLWRRNFYVIGRLPSRLSE